MMMMKWLSSIHVALLVLFCICLVDLWWCPFSKVEESFPLQATHDLYYYGVAPAWQAWWWHDDDDTRSSTAVLPLPYDHLEYPGVVPRSFVAPFVLATLCRLTQMMVWPVTGEWDSITVQFWVRLWLLVLYIHGWYHLATVLNRQGQREQNQRHQHHGLVGTYTLLVTASQFHLTFYASRVLPNMLATVPCLHAWAFWLSSLPPYRHHHHHHRGRQCIVKAAVCLIVATAVLRCDVLLLLVTVGLTWLWQRYLTVVQALKIGLVTGLVTLLITVPLDSLLWQKLTWPEGQVFYYNAILGQSEHWGISPWYWYFTAALPKALLGSLVLMPLCVVDFCHQTKSNHNNWLLLLLLTVKRLSVDTTWFPVIFAWMGFIVLYSCLGHKEVRFLFPSLPLANILAAVGWSKLHRLAWPINNHDMTKKKHDDAPPSDTTTTTTTAAAAASSLSVPQVLLRRGLYFGACGLVLTSWIASTVFVAVSRQNYPGGVALQTLATQLHQQQQQQEFEKESTMTLRSCRIYIDNAAAMTGVSLFGQDSLPTHCTIVKAGYEADKQNLLTREDDTTAEPLTHLITEHADLGGDAYQLLATIPGHPQLNWRHASIDTSNALYILERVNE